MSYIVYNIIKTYHEGTSKSSPYAVPKRLDLNQLQDTTKVWQVACSQWHSIPGHRIWDSKTSWSISYQPSLWCNQVTTGRRTKMTASSWWHLDIHVCQIWQCSTL